MGWIWRGKDEDGYGYGIFEVGQKTELENL
jgi:hypothetical protein